MSPEVSYKHMNRANGRKQPLFSAAAALVMLVLCALFLAGSAQAWTPLPEDGLAMLSEEQRTLIESLPEGDRPLAYCLLTGTDTLTFFRQYSGYADLIAREGLTSSMATARYMTGTRHPDFSTPEGQAEKQFLLELNIALGGWFCSYNDPADSSISIFYSESLQNKSLEQLTQMRSSLDTGRIFNTTELPMWKRILDAWIVYRGGSAESQTTGNARELLEAYNTGAYPEPDAEERRLLEEMPEAYRLLTYAALTGTDGLSWLRENSPADFETIESYWDMDLSALSEAYGAMASAGGEGGIEAMLLQQLFMLRAKTYVWLQAGTWGLKSRDTIRMQDLARGGDKLVASVETIEGFLDENSASIGWSAEGEMALACQAWLDYFERIMPEEAARERARRREEAARSALLAESEVREWSDTYRAEKGLYAIPAVSSVPEDAVLDDAQIRFLRSVPMRYLPHAYHYLRADLSTEQVMAACVASDYRNTADGLLLYSQSELEAEYISLLTGTVFEDLSGAEAARLELCAEILLCRYQDAGKISFGTMLAEYDNKNSRWRVAYYAEFEDPLQARSIDSLEEQARKEAERADPQVHADVLDAGVTAALAEYKRNMKATPPLDAKGQRIYAATVPEMRAYAAAIVTGVIDPYSGLEYAEMPEQLWARRENKNYGGMSINALNKLLSYYGAPPYHGSSHVSWYTAPNSNLQEIVNSVNQYTAEAVMEAQRILWHRNAEFYSTGGNYHAQLARMSADALYSYRTKLEAEYYSTADTATAELRNWIEQVNAWMDWTGERRTQKEEKEREEAAVWGAAPADPGVPAEDRTYILELSTGTVSGDNIEFFRIVYEAEDGDTRTQYIFPTEDSLRSGYRIAAEAGTPLQVLEWVKTVVGYDTADPYLSESLQSFRTDQFLFTADGAIKNVTEIQAFMRRDGAQGKNEWTCTGLRLYKVDALQGLARYGYCSSDCYIDFRGDLIAELSFADENLQNISWRSSDTLFRFGGDAGTTGYSLSRPEGKREIQSTRQNVIFRIDFADQYMAGLECLASDYQGTNKKSLTRPGGLCEALALQVRYRDTHGAVREVTLPVISSAAAWSVLDGGVSGIEDYAGLAQQGESLGFAGTLPELAEVLYVTPVLGGDAAAAAARITPDPAMPAAAARDSRIAASNGESAAILAIAVYDAARARLSAAYEDGFLRFDFPSIPEKFYRAADITGLRLDAGGAAGRLRMEEYTGSGQLLPRDQQERYLVTLMTDDAEMAGTSSDVVLRLGYEDVDGNEKQTPEFMLRDYAGDYYGYWPASAGDFGYLYGLSSNADGGRSLSVLLPVQDVHRFTSVTIRLAGHEGESIDEWQMKDLSIQTVGSIGARSITWKNVGVAGSAGTSARSDRVFSRSVSGSVIFKLSQGGAVDRAKQRGPGTLHRAERREPGSPFSGRSPPSRRSCSSRAIRRPSTSGPPTWRSGRTWTGATSATP